jgi:hypothetical protein
MDNIYIQILLSLTELNIIERLYEKDFITCVTNNYINVTIIQSTGWFWE